jgi:uncharacterized membrane protein YukC
MKSAREVLGKTELTKDELDKASDELNQILQTVGAAIYQQQTPPTGGPEAGQPTAEEPKAEAKADDKKEAEEGEVVQ